jgi:hypothetical protein
MTTFIRARQAQKLSHIMSITCEFRDRN